MSALVLAPGVPLTHPEPHWVAQKATEAAIEVIGDIELYARERAKLCPDAPFIAVTGTNGKSTTTALIAHILRSDDKDVQMGGNIGTPILTLEPPARDRFHVIEMSSFQIDLTPTLRPTVGVLLNITPDHIDRHGTVANYAAIKERLVRASEIAVVGVDDAFCVAIAARVEASGSRQRRVSGTGPGVIPISSKRVLEDGVFAQAGVLYEAIFGETHKRANLAGISSLRGSHNWQNAAAAFAAAKGVNVIADTEMFKRFSGLPHRLEVVNRYGPVDFINDSKATNADSTEKALASFEGNVFWILGGRPKAGGIRMLEPHFPRVSKAYLIGEASDEFATTLTGKVAFEHCGTLDQAVKRATADALEANKAEATVLLSPACASYDQFKNFEVRGDEFRRLVAEAIAARGGT